MKIFEKIGNFIIQLGKNLIWIAIGAVIGQAVVDELCKRKIKIKLK